MTTSRWLSACAAALAWPAAAHEPITTKLTWTQEISRIFYRRCVGCHREGGRAPMPLTTYEQARPWAVAIKEEVLERRMPPWGAVKGFGEFRDDPSLSLTEIDWIVNWVEGGAPDGNEIFLPDLPPARKAEAGLRPGASVSVPATLGAARVAVSIHPRNLPTGADMEVIALRPDRTAQHLIWIRNYKEAWDRTYWFRQPVRLPKGARIEVRAPAGATAELGLGR